MNDKLKSGIILAIITAIISGFSIFYNKLVIVKGIDPLIFNIIKNGGVALILTTVLLSKKKTSTLIHISRKAWLKLFAIGIIGGCIPFILYFEGLKSVSALNANIIQKTLFIWVAMMAIPVLGEKLSRIQVVGYSLIIWSNLFIGGFTGFQWSQGEVLIVIATLLWSVENVLAKFTLKDIESLIVAWARMFIGVLFMIAIAFFQGKISLLTKITPDQLFAMTGSILFLTMYVTHWYKALSLAPATVVTSILVLATPVTNVLSAIFITHTLPSTQVINLVGTSIGICFIALLSRLFEDKSKAVTTA